jgi:hypothetical protein
MLSKVHHYYKDKWFEFLKIREFDESLCPSIYKIDEILLDLLAHKKLPYRKRTSHHIRANINWDYFKNIDISDLHAASSQDDYERSFLDYYKASITPYKINRLVTTNYQRNTFKLNKYMHRENWVPVWPQLDGGYITKEEEEEKLDTTYTDLDLSSVRRR